MSAGSSFRLRPVAGVFALVVVLGLALASAAPADRSGGRDLDGGDARDLPRVTLLNASYDATRELYRHIDTAFADLWRRSGKGEVVVRLSHGGSGKQARSVLDGLRADVVSLALGYDIDSIARRSDLLPVDWNQRLPHNGAPFTSTVVLMVREGNPKNIRDFDDLLRDDVTVITPNPKTSGGARWNHLALLGYFRHKHGGDEERALRDVASIYRRVPVLDTGARGSTTTFVRRGMGDVLISWENEALHVLELLKDEGFEIVTPSVSIRTEMPVSVVDGIVDRRGTREVAQAYVDFLFSPQAQEIAARQHFRPRDPEVAARHAHRFPELRMLSIDEDFGGWAEAQSRHFDDGGSFDRIHMQVALGDW